MVNPVRAVSGMTVLISRSAVRIGIASSVDPKPERPCVKPAKKIVIKTNR